MSLTFVRSGASFTQSDEWPLKIGTVVSLTGQYSPDALPTSEQISFGAQRFALGYQPGEVSGDSGRESFDVVPRFIGRDVATRLADYHRILAFIVEVSAIGGLEDLAAVTVE